MQTGVTPKRGYKRFSLCQNKLTTKNKSSQKNKMKLQIRKHLPPWLGSSGGISDSAAKVLNFVSELSPDSILSQEEITEEVEDEMFISKFDDK